jgi:dihydropteroate synthase
VISEILKRVSKISLKPNKIIWNDVSGVFDADTIQVLKDNPDLMYVYSHNFVPQKNQTSEHMQFINSELDVPGDMIEYFQQFTDLWQKNFGKRCVYLDPCLGFAKTREQNQLLLQFLPELVGKFSHEKWIHWLIGMSRKSFLRFPLNADKNPTLLKKTEIIEALYWFEHLPKFANSQISIRIHDSNVLKAIQDYFELT